MERSPQHVRDRRGTNFLPACAVVFGATLIIESALGIDLNFIAVILGFAFALWASRGVGWAWIPAIVILSGPALEIIGGVFGMRSTPDVSIPLLLMVAGGVLVFREHFPPGMARVLLVGLLILGVISMGDNDNEGRNFNFNNNNGRDRTTTVVERGHLPKLEGRRLVIQAATNEVSLTETGDAGAQRLPKGIVATVTADQVLVVAPQGLELDLPTNADVLVRSATADVEVEVTSADVEVQTASGSVDVTVHADPDVVLTTQSGDIDLDGYEGDDDPKGTFESDGRGPRIKVTTVSGHIDLTRDFDPPTTTSAPLR